MNAKKSTKSTLASQSTSAQGASSALSSTASPAVSSPAATSSTPTALAGTELPPISGSVVAQCTSLLNQVGDLLGPVEELSVLEIRHALKMRKGGAQIVPKLANLCAQNGITSVGNMSTAGMTDLLERANSLNTISVALGALRKKIDDASFTAESTAWQSATTFYTLLQRVASRSPTLTVALQPIQAFFQTKRTKGNRQAATAAAKVKAAAKAVAKHPEAAAGTQAPPAGGTSGGSPPTGSSSAGAASGVVGAGGAPVTAGAVAAPVPSAAASNGAAHS